MSWDPPDQFLNHSAPEPDGVQGRSGELGSFNALPEVSHTMNQHTSVYDRPSTSTSHSTIAGFLHGQFSDVSQVKTGGHLTGYTRHNATHDFTSTMNHMSMAPFDFHTAQDLPPTQEPTQGRRPGDIDTELSGRFGAATIQYTYDTHNMSHRSRFDFYTDPSSLHRSQSSSTGEEPSTTNFRPLTPPNLHRQMKKRCLSTTSGDPSTVNSTLFKEDTPKVISGNPLLISQNTIFTPIHEIERPPSPSAASTNDSDGFSVGDQSTLSDAPPDNNLNGGAFPDDPKLRDLWKKLQTEEIGKDGKPLYRFLNSVEGDARPWKCLFSDNSGRCTKTFLRRDKAAGHIRDVHLQNHPYCCNGACGVSNCSRKFSIPAGLSGHLRNVNVECKNCHQYTSEKNLSRHWKTAKCRQRSLRGMTGGNS